MARTSAYFKTAIWRDDEFRSLPSAAQHLYVALWTSDGLSYCGVADWRPARIAKVAADLTSDGVVDAGLTLHRRLYVVVDEETEEVLIRSFIRNDGLMEQPNVAAAMVRDYGKIASPAIRGVVIHELHRLFEEAPDLKGWRDAKTGKERASSLLKNPSVDPSLNPSGWGSEEVEEGVTPTLPVALASLPSPSPTPSPNSISPSVGRAARGTQIPDDWKPKEAHLAIAQEYGLDPAFELRSFRDHYEATGKTHKNWDAAFRSWLNKSKTFRGGQQAPATVASSRKHIPAEVPEHIDPNDAAAYAAWVKEATK